jgi:hypothetical protein
MTTAWGHLFSSHLFDGHLFDGTRGVYAGRTKPCAPSPPGLRAPGTEWP